MNLYRMLAERAEEGRPVRVGLIGAGKFGSMFLAQARRMTGLHLMGVADLSLERARAALQRTGWEPERVGATSFDEALKRGTTHLTPDALAMIAAGGLDVVVDATGNPEAGIRHVLACCEHGKHVVLVNVEADALAGPLLAQRARQAGIVYSLAYGDQPALICEMVDWARACGFEVVCAGKGTKYLPVYHTSTPDTVWQYFGFSDEEVARGDFNAKMFNSFVDGTKSAIEMAAVANATGLAAPADGLAFPPAGADELARVLRPRQDGGVLERTGIVEVVSSLDREGDEVPRDLRWGVYVCFKADGAYVRDCFRQYGLVTDDSGYYSALYRPYHLIGLELGISIASAALRHESTGAPVGFQADVVATAKRDIAPGEMLDGEGGYLVWGKLMPASASLARGGLPIGLAHGLRVKRAVAAGTTLTWEDVDSPEDAEAVRIRREMEVMFRRA
jgi:predicted homoserine dehydrogenase-like protein